MNDDVLYSLQRDPAPDFASELRTRLRRQRADASPQAAMAVYRRWGLAAAAVVVVAVALSLPGVRASAQSFLSLFRVARVVGVPLANREGGVTGTQLDLPHLIDRHLQVLEDPGAPVVVLSVDAASAAAGYAALQPADVPRDTTLTRIAVQGRRAVRFTMDIAAMREGLNALGIRDVELPQDADGQFGFIRTRPVVGLTYTNARGREVTLLQTPTPEISLPAGVDIRQLGEMALRIAGLPAADARRMADAIDWSSTLLVPVPPQADSFRQVEINGREGVLIQTRNKTGSVVLWPGNDRVFALAGPIAPTDALQMAVSVR